jgi:DNA-binding transcriptional ArsR family regulator
MDEIIVAVARAVACPARLRILSRLSRVGESAPTALARDLPMPLDQLCIHLRRLATAGLIGRRRSGCWCYCQPRSPYGPHALSGKLARWLYRTLRDPRQALKGCEQEARESSGGEADKRVLHRVLFEVATAFTHPRRLQLLRRLRAGPADVAALVRELHMSDAAVSRHTGKLRRRGYVTTRRAGRTLTYELAPRCKTPLHARWLAIVREEWEKR